MEVKMDTNLGKLLTKFAERFDTSNNPITTVAEKSDDNLRF